MSQLTQAPLPPTPYETLLGEMDRVLGEWRTLVAREPWMTVPATHLLDSLPEILPRIVRLARDGARALDPELSEMVARAHGWFRRQDALPLSACAEEWAHVKRACWIVLEREGIAEEERTAVLRRLDALIDDAVGYTIRGYYGPELDVLRGRGLERRGELPDRRKGNGDRREN